MMSYEITKDDSSTQLGHHFVTFEISFPRPAMRSVSSSRSEVSCAQRSFDG